MRYIGPNLHPPPGLYPEVDPWEGGAGAHSGANCHLSNHQEDTNQLGLVKKCSYSFIKCNKKGSLIKCFLSYLCRY